MLNISQKVKGLIQWLKKTPLAICLGAGSLTFMAVAIPTDMYLIEQKPFVEQPHFSAPPEKLCHDSDGGKNTSKKGTVVIRFAQSSTPLKTVQDYCLSGTTVREYSCEVAGDTPYATPSLASEDVVCADGMQCKHGACVPVGPSRSHKLP